MHHQRAVILWILITPIFTSGNTDDPKDKSICKSYHRITATKSVSYQEEYYDGYYNRRTRTNYRVENFTKWDPVEMCCQGYEPHGKAEEATTCVPVCPSDCLHGKCVEPNQCECEPGYRNVTNTEFNECTPVCSSGCHGGTCVDPNICECDMGYILTPDKGSCKPICNISSFGPQGCGHNASCIAPNTCQCDNGYTATTNLSTIPDLNFMGAFVWKTDDLKEISKNLTFNATDVICVPSCTPKCDDDSSCVAPNKCECKTGYERTLMSETGGNGSRCIPTCHQTCFHGSCVAPNKCACLEGYKPHDVLEEDFCEPICDEECVNGKCTQPGVCECSDGYQKQMLGTEPHETSKSVCTPICPGRCPNGTCVSPGKCHCDAGYILDFRSINETETGVADTTVSGIRQLDYSLQQFCRPTCKPDCPMGSTCAAPNRCQIDDKLSDPHSAIFKPLWIVNSTGDCGSDGLVYAENGACGCEYRVNGKKYIEPGLCAIIFTDGEECSRLNSIMLFDYDYAASFDTTDLIFRRKECRTLILPKKNFAAVSRKTEHCHLLEIHTESISGINISMRRFTLGKGNETVICLSTEAETMCGPVESKIKKVYSQTGGVVGIVFGMIILIILIGAAIYLARRKTRPIGIFGATSRSNGNIMERSETMDSPLHTLDGSDV